MKKEKEFQEHFMVKNKYLKIMYFKILKSCVFYKVKILFNILELKPE